MTAPAPENSGGYDIMIWADDSGRILAKSFTILGEVILRGLEPNYQGNAHLEIRETPSVFFAEIPRKTRIGLVNPETNDQMLVAFGGLQ